MKRLTIPLIVVAAALLGNVAFGQEAAGIPAEIIKELDSLVGTWQVEGKVGDKVQTGGFTCRWARTEEKKKVCLIGQFSYNTGGKAKSGVTLIGWNAAKKCIEDRGFDANGGNGRLMWIVKSPTEWQGEVVFVENGLEVKSKAILIKKGPSEIVMESEGEAGEASRFVFRKVTEGDAAMSKEPPRVPEGVAKVLDFSVGQWTVEGKEGDSQLTGKAVFRMPPGKHCIMGTVSFQLKGEQTHFSLVSGWDSSTGWITEQGIESDGLLYSIKWRKVTPTVDEGELIGSLGGKKWAEKDRLERKGDDKYVVTCTERTAGDDKLPDLTFIFHRVPREKAKSEAAK